MLKSALILCLCLAQMMVISQNLVPNSGFEDYPDCPEDLHELPIGWDHWLQSPNSFNTCVEPSNFNDSLGDAPYTGFGYQWPFQGEGFIGLCTYGQPGGNNFREIIGCELGEALIIGEQYTIEMRVNLSWGGYFYNTWASNNIGVLFTNQAYQWQVDPFEIPGYAHFHCEEIIDDTLDWTLITGQFIADSNYTHMAIGNFLFDEQTDTLHLSNFPSACAYYFVDNPCVVKGKQCDTSLNNIENSNDSWVIYPNPVLNQVTIKSSTSGLFRLQNDLGQVVVSRRISKGESIIDISGIESGMYFVTLEGNNFYELKKLIIEHD